MKNLLRIVRTGSLLLNLSELDRYPERLHKATTVFDNASSISRRPITGELE